MKKLLISFFALILFSTCKANNLSITNVSLTGQDTGNDFTLVQFDLSWDNSWRLSSRRDAAWIFVKYKIGGAWNHATINYVDGTATNDGHTEATGSTVETPSDGMGVFIYRDADGNGTNSFTTIQLRWNYGTDGVTDDAIVDIQIFGIEMVYVPTGSFAAGSGGTGNSEFILTTINTGLATTTPSGSGGLGGEAGGYPTSQTSPTFDTWPNGYNDFYCMKYEVSEDQYVTFLNTLTRTQQNSRTETDVSTDAITNIYAMTNTSGFLSRNKIFCPSSGNGTVSPITFSTSIPDVPCSYVNWTDTMAYADWAGLRPMTELEFEKACRGTSTPVADEYAWGSVNIHSSTYGEANYGTSSESLTNMGVGTGNCIYSLTYFNTGQKRCGIMAASASNNTREETGATYYGIMEMSGNLFEQIVSINQPNGRLFTGLHGNGSITSSGISDVSNWPSSSGLRGGSWNYNGNFQRISD